MLKLWLLKWKIWSSTSLWCHLHVFYTYFSVFGWNYIMWLFKWELLGSTFVCTCVLQYFTKWKSWEIFLNLDLRYSKVQLFFGPFFKLVDILFFSGGSLSGTSVTRNGHSIKDKKNTISVFCTNIFSENKIIRACFYNIFCVSIVWDKYVLLSQ